MRHTTKTLLVAILVTSAAARALDCSPPDTQELVGLWESRDTSKGGIGHTVELRPDGSYVEATTVLVNGAYRVSGDQLIVAETAKALEGDTAAQGSRFEIEGDTLIQARPDGTKLKKERLGKAVEGAPAIVGAWKYRHDTGATAFERYTPDGRMLFRLPMRSTTGCYEIAGGQISFASPLHKQKKEATFETRSGELILKDPRKPVAVYTRDEAGPWYDREHITINSREKN
jgi:hypothetical protein